MTLTVLRAETVTGEIVVCRPVRDVYGFYRDFANLPRFIGDVVAVERVGDATYRWLVSGPFGARIPVVVSVTEQRVDRLIRYQTRGAGPLRARWQLEFIADGEVGRTLVRERLTMPLGAVGRFALALIGKFPDREVRDNLNRLKELLESGSDGNTPAAARPTSSGRQAAPKAGERGTS
jgi:uncharacterized membrane protein